MNLFRFFLIASVLFSTNVFSNTVKNCNYDYLKENNIKSFSILSENFEGKKAIRKFKKLKKESPSWKIKEIKDDFGKIYYQSIKLRNRIDEEKEYQGPTGGCVHPGWVTIWHIDLIQKCVKDKINPKASRCSSVCKLEDVGNHCDL